MTTEDGGANAPMAEFWNGAGGANWIATQAEHARQLAPWGDLLVDAVAPQPGERAVDVGCGCGEVTIEVALRTGANTTVGVDISEPMLGRARALAEEAGVEIEFRRADAQVDDLTSIRAAIVLSRFGVMFFDDPTAAFANLRRATLPGGRLAFVCWQALDRNPWMSEPAQAGAAVVEGFEPLDPDAPGPWAFGDPDRVREILRAAGWSDVGLDPAERPMVLGDTVEAASLYFLTSGAGQRLVAAAGGSEGRDRVIDAVAAALRPYLGPDGVAPPSAGWLVTGVNP